MYSKALYSTLNILLVQNKYIMFIYYVYLIYKKILKIKKVIKCNTELI